MPETGIVGKEYDLNPALTKSDEALIDREARGYFVPGKRAVQLDIYITKAHQSFKIGEMEETLSLEFVVRIEMVNTADPSDVSTAVGKGAFVRKSVHVGRESVPDLYDQVIRESLSDAFNRIMTATR